MVEDMLDSFFSTSLTAMLLVLCVMFWGAVFFGGYVLARIVFG